MKKIILFVILFTVVSFSQQDKYTTTLQTQMQSSLESEKLLVWVFFTDKGIETSQYLSQPLSVVSEKSLQRRAKVLPANALIDVSDVPVNNG